MKDDLWFQIIFEIKDEAINRSLDRMYVSISRFRIDLAVSSTPRQTNMVNESYPTLDQSFLQKIQIENFAQRDHDRGVADFFDA